MAIISNTYTGDGSTVIYSLSFPYIEQSHVKATINGTPTTAFTFVNATTIQFGTAPANGAAIVLFRDTPIDELNSRFFPNSSIRSDSLNNNFTQGLYVAQETNSLSTEASTNSSNALSAANAAIITANAADATANAADAKSDQAIIDSAAAVVTANTAESNSLAAINTANLAESNSLAAVSTANAASAAVTAAVFYTPVADLAALALLTPGDGFFFELQNSTGADTDPSITGIPGGLVGAAGLTFRLRYDDPPGEYVFLGYFASDSETRYLKSGVGQIVNADINASASIVDTKLATITTAGKVNNSATTATSANTPSSIVARDVGGNFTANTITANLTGTASNVITNANLTGDVTSVGNTTAIAAGAVVDADINASANIASSKLSFTQAGGGAVTRTVDNKLKDVVSVKDFGAVGNGVTNDTTAIQNAIASLAANQIIDWGSGGDTFVVTSNITGLLSRLHTGKARLSTPTGTYHIGEGWTGVANTIYVSPSGVTTNDGLTSSTSLDFSTGFNIVKLQAQCSPGASWKLKILGGTYPNGAARRFEDFPQTLTPVVFEGETSSGVPTSIFNGWSNSVFRCVTDGGSCFLTFKDLKFTNSTNQARILIWGGRPTIYCENLHVTGSITSEGTFSFRNCNVDFRGGLIDGAEGGIVYQNCYGSIGDDESLSGTYSTTFSNITNSFGNATAIQISRGSKAYVRRNTFSNNDIHIELSRIARMRTQSNTFGTFNSFGIKQETGPTVWNDDLSNFDVFSGATLGSTFLQARPGSTVSRYATNSSALVEHLAFNNTVTFTGTTRAEPSSSTLSPFRPPGYWLMSPSARGIVEYVVFCPIAETVTLQISGEGAGTGVVLASIILNPTAASWFNVRFSISGPFDGGTVGRFFTTATAGVSGGPATITVNRGPTSALNQASITGTSGAPKRFRFYVTRSVGTSNMEIYSMVSQIAF
jgi:hypothetical protein